MREFLYGNIKELTTSKRYSIFDYVFVCGANNVILQASVSAVSERANRAKKSILSVEDADTLPDDSKSEDTLPNQLRVYIS